MGDNTESGFPPCPFADCMAEGNHSHGFNDFYSGCQSGFDDEDLVFTAEGQGVGPLLGTVGEEIRRAAHKATQSPMLERAQGYRICPICSCQAAGLIGHPCIVDDCCGTVITTTALGVEQIAQTWERAEAAEAERDELQVELSALKSLAISYAQSDSRENLEALLDACDVPRSGR